MDAGAVMEFYPTPRAIVRFDAGDTVVRTRNATGGVLGSPRSSTHTTHNFQASIGFGYRF